MRLILSAAYFAFALCAGCARAQGPAAGLAAAEAVAAEYLAAVGAADVEREAALTHPDALAAFGAFARPQIEARAAWLMAPLGFRSEAELTEALRSASDAELYVTLGRAVPGGVRPLLFEHGRPVVVGSVADGALAHVVVRAPGPPERPEVGTVTLRRSGPAWRVAVPLGSGWTFYRP